MRCKYTKAPMCALWKHPDLDGQYVAALTRQDAMHLCHAIIGKSLSVDGFSRTGAFTWRPRIINTIFEYNQVVAETEAMIEDDVDVTDK